MSYDSTQDTLSHIRRVQELLWSVCQNLEQRALSHDQSKLHDPEKEVYDQLTPRLKGLTYASEQYRACLREMKPAIEHHYQENDHHPEHFEKGIAAMSLFSLMEMVCDWKAASERHSDGDIWRSLEICRTRFEIGDQLYEIISNTFKELGF